MIASRLFDAIRHELLCPSEMLSLENRNIITKPSTLSLRGSH